MKRPKDTNKYGFAFVFCCVFVLFSGFLTACGELEKPKPEPFYAGTAPPQKKEFRWSNGKTPKSFDPALASAAPEIDVVRALFEGLTDTDAKTLKTVPAIAAEWNSSEDFKIWTFKLRRDARWSNGKPVTAGDFARSWKRLVEMREKIPHPNLLRNIVGIPPAPEIAEPPATESGSIMDQLSSDKTPLLQNPFSSNRTAEKPNAAEPENKTIENKAIGNKIIDNKSAQNKVSSENAPKPKTDAPEIKFGVEAVSDYVLKVSLIEPDREFPSLAAHPNFRPIFGDGKQFETEKLNAGIVTSGAFRIASVGQDGITLDRSAVYWNSGAVELERVRFVPIDNAETALESYRAGEIDALTNVSFEPLALKLLEPFGDFRRTTHNALNFYEFNRANAPFNDRRVREALSIAIERERLTEDDMDGATEPAFGFLPTKIADGGGAKKIRQDEKKAGQLMTEAGFPNGENFPVVRLLVNRNDIQQKIARSVAGMWKRNLNVETQIIVKDIIELEAVRKSGEFDLVRRGVVFPTIDETANMLAIFEPEKKIINRPEDKTTVLNAPLIENSDKTQTQIPDSVMPETEKPISENISREAFEAGSGGLFLTEAEAVSELPAIPLYFPTSYSLVKPYIQGFEINTLDAPSLKDVRIDNNWQPE